MNAENYNNYFEANREGWNKRTAIHKTSAFYDVASFKAGKSSLNKLELEEVGDVKGKSLLHLQCHFGLDTLSWAREGANVTGIDISDDAIVLAKELSKELQIPAQFVRSNVYDLKENLHQKFDIIFTSYGVVGWLPDLNKWADIINHLLKPGGTFYMVEFHPVIWMMDDNFEQIKYHYHNVETIVEQATGTYSNPDADINYTEYGWNHSLAEVINPLLQHNMQLQFLHEFSYSNYNCFNNMEKGADGNWRVKNLEDKIPMMYSIRFKK
jgi:2-polyprenyl-3-methyl-5-hydroxy-6-metoxy-1,4-benzoquinol methylase